MLESGSAKWCQIQCTTVYKYKVLHNRILIENIYIHICKKHRYKKSIVPRDKNVSPL